MKTYPPNLLNILNFTFAKTISEQIKILLEQKHLYQNVNIQFSPFDEMYNDLQTRFNIEECHPNSKRECKTIYEDVNFFLWKLPNSDRKIKFGLPNNDPDYRVSGTIEFTPPETLHLFCNSCKSVQPFNCITGDILSNYIYENKGIANIQTLSLAYECQSCKNFPTYFLVSRNGLKINLTGRAPIELSEVPKSIPNAQVEFFSDAIIAFQTNQILAGKFLLRTVIEQYIRDFTDDRVSLNLDNLFDQYSQSLPLDFKERFPSLTTIYGQLSSDIHNADKTPEVFTEALNSIILHFDAIKIYKSSTNQKVQ